MARNEIGDRARQRFWLVAVRRMAAIREYDDFAVPDARVDAGDLRERTVLVVFALQVLVSVFSLLRESGEDESFAGDKLGYRS